jgi:LCP family protein required for cell wall assembly
MNRHLSDGQLLAYVEDNLSTRRHERVEQHLCTCPACRARLEQLARTAADLTTTLHDVGEQIPLAPARSWDAVAGRLNKEQPKTLVPPLRPLLRHVAALSILILVAAGLAGLIHTLAVTGPAATQATPTSAPTPLVDSSPAPGPLPRPYPGSAAAPASLLILGSDGESVASDETDTLMLLYLDAGTECAFALSIPRDLYVDVPGHAQARAGSVYGLGQKSHQDTSGLVLAKEAISATLGFPVQHAALIHFDGFITLIDAIGGVDVEVPHPIEDPKFPDDHGGRDPLRIPAGTRHFDGDLALQYARTRIIPAPGFDRAFRQQQIVLAVHDRVTHPDRLPDLIADAPNLWSAIADGIETDLSLSDAIDMALLVTNVTADGIRTASLDDCCTIQQTTPTGERVLLPQADEITALMDDLLEESQ